MVSNQVVDGSTQVGSKGLQHCVRRTAEPFDETWQPTAHDLKHALSAHKQGSIHKTRSGKEGASASKPLQISPPLTLLGSRATQSQTLCAPPLPAERRRSPQILAQEQQAQQAQHPPRDQARMQQESREAIENGKQQLALGSGSDSVIQCRGNADGPLCLPSTLPKALHQHFAQANEQCWQIVQRCPRQRINSVAEETVKGVVV